MYEQNQTYTRLSRAQIKANSKQAMGQQRGITIGITALYMLIAGAGSIFAGIPMLGAIIVMALPWFITMPLAVGMSGSFLNVYGGQQIGVGDMFTTTFTVNYIRKVGGMAWMALWVTLWSLLFVIPGIIKAIAYSMTGYILAAHPNVTATDALKLSMRMTQGHKGELFMFYLSFIGWLLLSGLTFGILYIVHVGPYMQTAMAGYFVELRNRAVASGAIQPHELDPQSVAAQ
ncbi:MAG: DUF975 family protein [Oscillospiraceae bacterium]|nr:DUF975 family protein [Oscillospiraceae bacterium]